MSVHCLVEEHQKRHTSSGMIITINVDTLSAAAGHAPVKSVLVKGLSTFQGYYNAALWVPTIYCIYVIVL